MKKEAAFSGLEAAIVLIAFVVVAAVFSYVMLGAGFFATQKSQEVTYSGIKQATSNMVLDGQLYGVVSSTPAQCPGDNACGGLKSVTFYLTVPEGGQPQSLSYDNLAFKYTVSSRQDEKVYGPISLPNPDNAGVVLGPGDKQEFSMTIPAATMPRPRPGDTLTIEILPRTGASSLISKTLVTGYSGGVII